MLLSTIFRGELINYRVMSSNRTEQISESLSGFLWHVLTCSVSQRTRGDETLREGGAFKSPQGETRRKSRCGHTLQNQLLPNAQHALHVLIILIACDLYFQCTMIRILVMLPFHIVQLPWSHLTRMYYNSHYHIKVRRPYFSKENHILKEQIQVSYHIHLPKSQ